MPHGDSNVATTLDSAAAFDTGSRCRSVIPEILARGTVRLLLIKLPTFFVVLSLAATFVLAPASIASAQDDPAACPEYQGVTCEGYVTDVAGVLDNRLTLEETASRMVDTYGHEVAVVLIDGAPGGAEQFAKALGETWVVKDKDGDAGGVVIVIDTASNDFWITAGTNLQSVIPSSTVVLNSAAPSFRNGDFDAGVAGMLGTLEASFEAETRGTSSGGSSGGLSDSATDDNTGSDGLSLLPLVMFGGLAFVAFSGRGRKRSAGTRRATEQDRRAQEVDDLLDRLETSAADLPDLRRYEVPEPSLTGDASLSQALQALTGVAERRPIEDESILRALWSRDLLDVIDAKRLEADTEVPLEMRASDDRDLLDDAVQHAAREALKVERGDTAKFQIKLRELEALVASVRPYRVAEKRLRFTQGVLDRVAQTSFGATVVSDRGERLLKAGAVIDAETVDDALLELDAAYSEAQRKVSRLDVIHDRLPDNAARPAVAAALTDLDDDPAEAVNRYERVRRDLRKRSSLLERDRLDVDAIAALLLLNRDELSVEEFVQLYRVHRERSMKPAMAVEYALAGLTTEREIARVRQYADGEGIPVAIVAALMRNREDGIEVYKMLERNLIAHDIKGESRRTIAGVLAASLEPAQAERRWLDARKALSDLGLVGSYADIAAAFGASDARGPRKFALAYAAQRQALSRSSIDDADRFAPELAHTGTSHQTDTWTGAPLPAMLRGFDPFTFFYLHWITTAGHTGRVGWEPVYNDSSWSGDRDSWFGGGFGSGSGGFGGGGGSSWGGGGWSSGSFGGFGGGFGGGGGGGFGGGGGGSW